MPLLPLKTPNRVPLEVNSEHYLDHSPTYVIGGGEILISICGLPKSGAAKISNAGVGRRLAADFEVNVVEGVQELTSELDVYPF